MNWHPGPIAVTRREAAQMLGISMTEVDDERRAGRLIAPTPDLKAVHGS